MDTERAVDMAELERDLLTDLADVFAVTIGRDPSGSGGIVRTETVRPPALPVGIGPAPRREIVTGARQDVIADTTLYFRGDATVYVSDRVYITARGETRAFDLVGKTKVTDARLIGMAAVEMPQVP